MRKNRDKDMNDLLGKLKNKDSIAGAPRDTLPQIAEDAPPSYEADEGPLSCATLEEIRKEAATMLPKGRVIKKRSLL